MTEVLPALIDKTDTGEQVRDRIGVILATELANQQALAVLAAKDPLDWTASVYVERNQPLEQWLNSGSTEDAATAPVISVWWESSNLNKAVSTKPGVRMVYDATYNVDMYARGFVSDVGGGGHVAADRAARLKCQATVRLVRNILDATENRYLQFPRPGLIWAHPAFENFEYFQPTIDDPNPNIAVWACRGRFSVSFNEAAPVHPTEPLEEIGIAITHSGEVVNVEIDHS